MRIAIHCTALALLTLSQGPVAGATDLGFVRIARVVKFGDLDLNREPGVAALYARLKAAAWQVCGPIATREPASIGEAQHCIRQAMEQAVADVESPGLTNLHQRLTGQAIVLAQGPGAAREKPSHQ